MKNAVKSTRPDRRVALLLFALCLGIYTRTLAPGLLDGDAGEFQFAAWRFGLAHPTGYPLYLLLGGSWQHLAALFGADPATSLNFFSAVLAALTVAIFYLAALRWLPSRGTPARVAALFASLLIGINPTLWSQALIAEVYTLHALFIAAFLFLTACFTRPPLHPFTPSPCHLVIFSSLLLGLSLTHHRTALFLLPGFLFWLVWHGIESARRNENQNADSTDFADSRRFLSALIRPIPSASSGQRRVIRVLSRYQWAALLGGLALPQLLYLYIPLRSGADASPWLYPALGGERLALYTPTWQGFVDFITGSVFAVSFLSPAQALARLPEAGQLWLVHFTWPGLALALLGLAVLVRDRHWPLLLLTLPAALLLQIFNLFYGIGDIYVFYIPLYIFAALWAACGAEWLMRLASERRTADSGPQTTDGARTTDILHNSQFIIRNSQFFWFFLLLLPASLFFTHLPAVDQSGNRAARQMWDAILAANPPGDAILISNDRNEIVPLYYLQAVEGRAPELTGIFPLLTPEERFADVGAVTSTALAAGNRPVYLIKEMPGLETRFELAGADDPLVRVLGEVDAGGVTHRLDLPYGPLTLLGFGVDAEAVTLFWRVEERLGADYTSSVQLFDAAGNKLAQDDRPPGGVFYPTSLWKPGEILRDVHPLPGVALSGAARLQLLLYAQPDLTPLAPALVISIAAGG